MDGKKKGWNSLIKQEQLDNFPKIIFWIKFCYGGAGIRYGVEEGFVLIIIKLFSNEEEPFCCACLERLCCFYGLSESMGDFYWF